MSNGVDVFMSKSKHTIPHAQSSPCVNLSIGARARQVQDGTGRVEPKTGNRKIERNIKGSETLVRDVVVKKTSISSACFHYFHSLTFLLCFS